MQMISKGLIAFLLITLQAPPSPSFPRSLAQWESPSWFEGSGPGLGKGSAPGTSAQSSRYPGYLPAALLLWLFRWNFPEMLPSSLHGNRSRNSGADIKPCCSHFAPGLPKLWIHSSDMKPRRMRAERCPPGRGTEAAAPARPSSAIYCHTRLYRREPARGRKGVEGKG